MPSKTFSKLPSDKQVDFLAVSLEEFASFDFEQASLSNIVRKLNIAKGSVYQYFENKWDLYEYLVTVAHDKLLEITSFVDSRASDDITLWFVQRTLAEIKFAEEFPLEFGLLTKTKLGQVSKVRSLGDEINQQEIQLIKQALKKSHKYKDTLDARSFITHTIKDSFIRGLQSHKKANEIVNQLYAFANILFR